MRDRVPADWAAELADLPSEDLAALDRWLARERSAQTVFPPAEEVFTALELTPVESVSVVILGQDPYHGEGQAHGLAFSVAPGVTPPPSLRNIYRELESDLGIAPRAHGDLRAWARQGVLLLNTVLTVRAHEAGSHRGRGWEQFSDGVIRAVSRRELPVVFLLWGNPARTRRTLIDADRHIVIESAHPSPLSAYRGFFGSRPFSQANAALRAAGRSPIDWALTTCAEPGR